jgi:HSP20 family molecular chaperone IbpA
MAITNSESKPIEEKKAVEIRYQVTPRYGYHFAEDGKSFVVEVALPGVNRDTIKIKALHDYFTLSAQRGEVGYKLSLDFESDFEVDATKVKANYHEGLLRVELPIIDPMSQAVEVKIE